MKKLILIFSIFLCGCPSIPPKKTIIPPKKTIKNTPPIQKKPKKTVKIPFLEKIYFSLKNKKKILIKPPFFTWKIPKKYQVRNILLNLYQKKIFEKGGKPELVVFDLKSENHLDLSKKNRNIRYYGLASETLKLVSKTTYIAVFIVEGSPKSIVKKVEFTTSP